MVVVVDGGGQVGSDKEDDDELLSCHSQPIFAAIIALLLSLL